MCLHQVLLRDPSGDHLVDSCQPALRERLADLLSLLRKLNLAGGLRLGSRLGRRLSVGLALERREAVNTSNLRLRNIPGITSSGRLLVYLPRRGFLLPEINGHLSLHCGFVKRPANSEELSRRVSQV